MFDGALPLTFEEFQQQGESLHIAEFNCRLAPSVSRFSTAFLTFGLCVLTRPSWDSYGADLRGTSAINPPSTTNSAPVA